jgi:imidazolonepropionase-like amidohydrolase
MTARRQDGKTAWVRNAGAATAGLALVLAVLPSCRLAAQTPVAPFTMPVPPAGQVIAITNATIMTASHGTIPRGTVLIQGGRIAAVGENVTVPAGARVIDGTGRYVIPGIVDAHSHSAAEAINEGTQSVTAEVRMSDVLREDGITIYRQLAGGVTSALVLHGSANTIGGQSVTIKMRYGMPAESLIFQAAPPGIKFALGENVRQTNNNPPQGQQRRYPFTRMGVDQTLRDAFTRAQHYQAEWGTYRTDSTTWARNRARTPRTAGPDPIPPARDLELDALVEVLNGTRLVHAHSYRSDEILMLLAVAHDFGFRVNDFTHVLEGYRVADELAAAGSSASTFADNWDYKLEAYDAIPFNMAIMAERGVLTSVNSDSDERARRLYQEAPKAMHYGGVAEEEALRMITLNPARQLGISERTGSIDVGKDADIAIFNGHPFAPSSRVEMTLVDGRVYFDRNTAPTLEERLRQMRGRTTRPASGGAQ